MEIDLRTHIAVCVSEAIRGTVEHDEEDGDREQNKNLWIQLVTDRILSEFEQFLPPPVDIESKYEVKPNAGVHINLSGDITDKGLTWDGDQLNYLASYADDEGYNRYHYAVRRKLESLYKVGEVALD